MVTLAILNDRLNSPRIFTGAFRRCLQRHGFTPYMGFAQALHKSLQVQ
jgi:hypothetical protein